MLTFLGSLRTGLDETTDESPTNHMLAVYCIPVGSWVLVELPLSDSHQALVFKSGTPGIF